MQMLSEHFSEAEAMCHCGRHTGLDHIIDKRLLDVLETMRAKLGCPLEVSCMYRCPIHNAEVNGVQNSYHIQGMAADVLVPDNYTVDQVADIAEQSGAHGVGRYYDLQFVHVDVRDTAEVQGWTQGEKPQ